MTHPTAGRLAVLSAVALAGVAASFAPSEARISARQDKLSIGVEAEQLGRNKVRITITGKKFTPNGTVFVTATPTPGTAVELDLGRLIASADGKISLKRDDLECSTPMQDDAMRPVFFTIVDSTTDRKAKQRVEGTAWLCR
jgi:hypothetical protein